eukprot:726894-Pyramimonas_sp.AAC.1
MDGRRVVKCNFCCQVFHPRCCTALLKKIPEFKPPTFSDLWVLRKFVLPDPGPHQGPDEGLDKRGLCLLCQDITQ